MEVKQVNTNGDNNISFTTSGDFVETKSFHNSDEVKDFYESIKKSGRTAWILFWISTAIAVLLFVLGPFWNMFTKYLL
ncbi:MAG: hypothetical protein PHF79_02530 [Candidatus Pacebacteria bacterium]|nr:hypothetical protein [Candidatus Paceibacterota bacterium]